MSASQSKFTWYMHHIEYIMPCPIIIIILNCNCLIIINSSHHVLTIFIFNLISLHNYNRCRLMIVVWSIQSYFFLQPSPGHVYTSINLSIPQNYAFSPLLPKALWFFLSVEMSWGMACFSGATFIYYTWRHYTSFCARNNLLLHKLLIGKEVSYSFRIYKTNSCSQVTCRLWWWHPGSCEFTRMLTQKNSVEGRTKASSFFMAALLGSVMGYCTCFLSTKVI